MSRLLVLGGGPAGLATAWLTARQGHDVELIERSPHLGGMAASFDVAGVRVDHGRHRLHRGTPPAVLSELQRRLGDDLQLRPRHGRLRFAGHWLELTLTVAGKHP